jgi:isoquinoline 1-oxidoreductase beta subunit
MSEMGTTKLSRRKFLLAAAGGGMTLALSSAGCSPDDPVIDRHDWLMWINISQSGAVEVTCPKMEMGQDVITAVSVVVAEELDAPWGHVTARFAPLSRSYGSLTTDDSASVRSNWQRLRELGAVARQALIRAAAFRWQVLPEQCTTRQGLVLEPSTDRQLSYGELVLDAAEMPIPAVPELKRRADYRLVGSSPKSLLADSMVDGSLKFASDIALPGMQHACILHSPVVSGSVRDLDSSEALAAPGVTAVVNLGNAVAIVADNFWRATNGRRALKVDWQPPETPALDTEEAFQRFREACSSPGTVVYSSGGSVKADDKTNSTYNLDFEVPFDAHATMEPMCCVADVADGHCEVWAPTQAPWSAYGAARQFGLSRTDEFLEKVNLKLGDVADNRVIVHTPPMGGGFGRRLKADYVEQAVRISREIEAPVKLIWHREEDLANGFYRAGSVHRIRVQLDLSGSIRSWHHRIAGWGILSHGIRFPYNCDSAAVEISSHDVGLPTGSMRSTAHTPNAFARESAIDSIARTFDEDPLEFRLRHLSAPSRLRDTLEHLKKLVDQDAMAPVGLGVAAHPFKESFIAVAARIARDTEGRLIIHRLTAVVDCGIVVHKSNAIGQVEGGMLFGLSSALHAKITVRNGRIEQRNFYQFPVLRIHETPEIDVHFLENDLPPGGLGEIGVPPVAPAIRNALLSITGTGQQSLPLSLA